jgi:hypothetical protein
MPYAMKELIAEVERLRIALQVEAKGTHALANEVDRLRAQLAPLVLANPADAEMLERPYVRGASLEGHAVILPVADRCTCPERKAKEWLGTKYGGWRCLDCGRKIIEDVACHSRAEPVTCHKCGGVRFMLANGGAHCNDCGEPCAFIASVRSRPAEQGTRTVEEVQREADDYEYLVERGWFRDTHSRLWVDPRVSGYVRYTLEEAVGVERGRERQEVLP